MNPGWRKNYLRYQTFFLNVIARYRERADVKAYIEILLSLATVSIFTIFALRPTLLTIAGLIKEIEAKEQTLEKMQTKVDNLTRAQTLYDIERQRINILLSSIPDNPNPENYARQVEGLSGKHASEISKISVGEAVILGKRTDSNNEKSKNAESLPEGSVGLEVSATYSTGLDRYASLSGIMSDFEKLRRPAKIDSIQIKTDTNDKKEKVLELSIEGRLPYFKGIK